jgi:hypothetical protein
MIALGTPTLSLSVLLVRVCPLSLSPAPWFVFAGPIAGLLVACMLAQRTHPPSRGAVAAIVVAAVAAAHTVAAAAAVGAAAVAVPLLLLPP